jgi:hypothetical protein
MNVIRTVPELGLVDATYFREGEALVQVCTRNRGGTSCGNEVMVMLGPTFCLPAPPHSPRCPPGERVCPGHGSQFMPVSACNVIQ